jgi:hypothetical protein
MYDTSTTVTSAHERYLPTRASSSSSGARASSGRPRSRCADARERSGHRARKARRAERGIEGFDVSIRRRSRFSITGRARRGARSRRRRRSHPVSTAQDGVFAEFSLDALRAEARFPFRLHLEQAAITPVLLDACTATRTPTFDFDAEVDECRIERRRVIARVMKTA